MKTGKGEKRWEKGDGVVVVGGGGGRGAEGRGGKEVSSWKRLKEREREGENKERKKKKKWSQNPGSRFQRSKKLLSREPLLEFPSLPFTFVTSSLPSH